MFLKFGLRLFDAKQEFVINFDKPAHQNKEIIIDNFIPNLYSFSKKKWLCRLKFKVIFMQKLSYKFRKSFSKGFSFSGNFGRFSSGLGLDAITVWGLHYMEQPSGHPKPLEETTVKKAKECIFEVEGLILEQGTCTFYGACRYHGQDYMYQVRLYRTCAWGLHLHRF